MKALLITGTLAENTVKQYAQQSTTPTAVLALNAPVAAFLTPQIISQALKKQNLKDIDIILTPGQMPGDTKTITEPSRCPLLRVHATPPTYQSCLTASVKWSFQQSYPHAIYYARKLQEKALAELEKVEQTAPPC